MNVIHVILQVTLVTKGVFLNNIPVGELSTNFGTNPVAAQAVLTVNSDPFPPPPPPTPIPVIDWRQWMLMVGMLWVTAAWQKRPGRFR